MRNKRVVRVSTRDLKRVDKLAHLSEFELISPANQGLVEAFLFVMGIDVDRVVHIQACNHRDLSNKTGIGYSFVGHERTDKLWLSRTQSTLEARIEAARDPDLQGDMIYMSTEGIPWNKFREMCDKARGQEGTTKNVAPMEPVEDFAESLQMMKLLRDIQIEIRGGINTIEEDMLFV